MNEETFAKILVADVVVYGNTTTRIKADKISLGRRVLLTKEPPNTVPRGSVCITVKATKNMYFVHFDMQFNANDVYLIVWHDRDADEFEIQRL